MAEKPTETPLSGQQIAALEAKYNQRFADHIRAMNLRQWAIEKAIEAIEVGDTPLYVTAQETADGPATIRFAAVTFAQDIYEFVTKPPGEHGEPV